MEKNKEPDKPKILVIDDEVHFLNSLADILTFKGYNVQKSLKGELGVKIAKEFLPDLILCDVSMSNMTGYEVLEELKKDKSTFNIPFIFLTGKAELQDIRKGMELGADDYLTKPFKTTDLLKAVDVRLKKHDLEKDYYENKLVDIKKVISKTLPHELRSPLNTILGFTQLIRSRYDDFRKHEILGMLQNIEDAGRKLLRLITNYNFYNRLVNDTDSIFNSGKHDVIYSSMVLESTPAEIASHYNRVDDLNMEINNATLHITNECFQKLVEELTDNAFKFSEKNSTVTIKTDIKGKNYIIEFIDTGVEFTKEKFDKIGAFEQFERDTLEQQGAGMGLAIVSQIINLWQGKLELTTKPGGLTKFRVTLPLSDEEVTL